MLQKFLRKIQFSKKNEYLTNICCIASPERWKRGGVRRHWINRYAGVYVLTTQSKLWVASRRTFPIWVKILINFLSYSEFPLESVYWRRVCVRTLLCFWQICKEVGGRERGDGTKEFNICFWCGHSKIGETDGKRWGEQGSEYTWNCRV